MNVREGIEDTFRTLEALGYRRPRSVTVDRWATVFDGMDGYSVVAAAYLWIMEVAVEPGPPRWPFGPDIKDAYCNRLLTRAYAYPGMWRGEA